MNDILGVAFGSYHSRTDWGLYQAGPASLSVPTVQTSYVDVPGRCGPLDFSTALTGEVVYGTRDFSVPFLSFASPEDWPALFSSILNAIHGQSMKIVLDEDPDYYYTGRVAVGLPTYDGTWQFTVTASVYPYKLRLDKTVVTATLSASDSSILLTNRRMPVVPSVTVDADTTLTWAGHSVALGPGADQTVPALVLKEGENTVKARVASGSGTITITYREGSL